jgi:hypothetical protein
LVFDIFQADIALLSHSFRSSAILRHRESTGKSSTGGNVHSVIVFGMEKEKEALLIDLIECQWDCFSVPRNYGGPLAITATSTLSFEPK